MSNLLGLHGYNKANGIEELIVVWANTFRVYNSSTGGWTGSGVHLTTGLKSEMRTFLDYVFAVNGTDANYSYDGTTWSTTTNLNTGVIGKYIEVYNTRIYLGNVKINGTSYPSRVWYSDLPLSNGSLRWGLQVGSDLAQTAASAVVTSATATFKTNNIKVGDKFTITSGNNAGEYTVKSIDSETQITLTTTLTYTVTNSSFWVGSNYFDVATDDGDSIMALNKNSGGLLIYKRNSMFSYTSSGKELTQVKNAPGTTSTRSALALGQYTYHYYPTGIYRYSSGESILLSNAVEDVIEGVTTANQDDVIAWHEKQKIVCFYLGDITLRDGTSITDCVIFYDTTSGAWSTRSILIPITAATTWLQSNVPCTYVGSDNSEVYKIDDGTSFDTAAIPFLVDTYPIFPAGTDTLLDFKRLRIYIDNGLDLAILFKLYYKPTKDDNQWVVDKDWQPLQGSIRAGKAEFIFPEGSRACGVALRFIESSTRESFLVEKVSLYYSNAANY